MNTFDPRDLPTINGEKIRLRPITWEDTPLIVSWRNNPSVRQNFIFRQPFTNELHENWLRTKVETGKVIQYIIIDKETDAPVGSVYFRDIDPENSCAEYGMFIGVDDVRGKGIGSETVVLFTRFGLDVLKLHRISMRVLADNPASRRSCEKGGFEVEGVFRDMVKLDGEYKDVVFMAMLNKE
jgi:RimJ/RimL family protein N-acetyltransferase